MDTSTILRQLSLRLPDDLQNDDLHKVGVQKPDSLAAYGEQQAIVMSAQTDFKSALSRLTAATINKSVKAPVPAG